MVNTAPPSHRVNSARPRRPMLIAAAVLAVLVLGAVWWLGQKAENAVPEAGEQRLEIENVFQ